MLEITIKGETKEIAALVLAIQGRQEKFDVSEFVDRLVSTQQEVLQGLREQNQL